MTDMGVTDGVAIVGVAVLVAVVFMDTFSSPLIIDAANDGFLMIESDADAGVNDADADDGKEGETQESNKNGDDDRDAEESPLEAGSLVGGDDDIDF